MTPEIWGTFALTVLVLNLTPGPDMAYILSRTLAQGAPAGIVSAAGVCSGALFHVGLATLLFTISLQISEAMQSAILLAGALYLTWLGISALREKPESFEIIPASDRKKLRRIFLEGVVVDILNPKVALFFLALLPVFISDRSGSPGSWFLMLGVLVVALSFLIEATLVLIVHRMRRMAIGEAASTILPRIMGVVFLGLAATALASLNFPVLLQAVAAKG